MTTSISLKSESASPPLLGQILLTAGAISPGDIERALQIQAEIGGRIGAILVRIGAISEDLLIQTLSEQLSIDILGGEIKMPSATTIWQDCQSAGISIDWLIDQQAIAWKDEDSNLLLYAAKDPCAEPLCSALELLCKDTPLQPFFIKPQHLDAIKADGTYDKIYAQYFGAPPAKAAEPVAEVKRSRWWSPTQ